MTQKTILCYGDSNTWGFVPSAEGFVPNMDKKILPVKRYCRTERWTGILQDLLGENYYVIEEGLNGRTTNLNYHIPPDRNGKTYLPSCLYTHAPIDLVILALGTNDLKVYFNRSAEDICNGLAELIDIIQTSPYGLEMLAAPKILIMAPSILLPIAETFKDGSGANVFAGAVKKSKQLVVLYSELVKEKNCYFLDVSKDITPSEIDGGHLDNEAHKKCAEMVCRKTKEIFR
ncbi:MAG: hypothetical protein A3E87_06530 [Gammaproteobacteria bacterium RIFCSPHIGHO2_12_FULL_35_23]|nr:MAG: hypothetical protein A3E87_06530 [Gammaproteobacteria bacterium RIFCSPHIGHO2_12_FULL_35_23]HLB43188.1 SGNH/GDSL hydrolase family protein [Gammaproteobacteria bacterium]